MDAGIECAASAVRGEYGEIRRIEAAGKSLSAVDLLRPWRAHLPETYASFQPDGRGEAVNLALYGVDRSLGLLVVQVRQARRRRVDDFMAVRKSYLLLGLSGPGSTHAVEAAGIHAGIRRDPDDPASAVRGALRWCWAVSADQLAASLAAGLRLDDLLLVLESRAPAGPALGDFATVGLGRFQLMAERIIRRRQDDRVFAFNPRIWRAGQGGDPLQPASPGWYSLRVAASAEAWNFAKAA